MRNRAPLVSSPVAFILYSVLSLVLFGSHFFPLQIGVGVGIVSAQIGRPMELPSIPIPISTPTPSG
jgi:hypothetical protein